MAAMAENRSGSHQSVTQAILNLESTFQKGYSLPKMLQLLCPLVSVKGHIFHWLLYTIEWRSVSWDVSLVRDRNRGVGVHSFWVRHSS